MTWWSSPWATAPNSLGHVGLVIGGGMMIEAYTTGYPIREAPYGNRQPVGFTRPWMHATGPVAPQ